MFVCLFVEGYLTNTFGERHTTVTSPNEGRVRYTTCDQFVFPTAEEVIRSLCTGVVSGQSEKGIPWKWQLLRKSFHLQAVSYVFRWTRLVRDMFVRPHLDEAVNDLAEIRSLARKRLQNGHPWMLPVKLNYTYFRYSTPGGSLSDHDSATQTFEGALSNRVTRTALPIVRMQLSTS